MTSNANRENEKIFKRLVAEGVYRVCKNGNMYKGSTAVGYKSNTGYIATAVKIKGRVHHIQLHRLVYLVHVGRIPTGLVINHKDGNKQNNAVSNLEAVSESENTKHAVRMGLHSLMHNVGCKNTNAKLTPAKVRQLRRMYASGKETNKAKLGRIFNLSGKSVDEVLKRRSYRDIE